jgi:ATP-dependent DNA ligase
MLVAFDSPFWDQRDLTGHPLHDRRAGGETLSRKVERTASS